VERPDANLLVRARLVAELGLLTTLMRALDRQDAGAVEVLTTQLRRLDDAVHTVDAHDAHDDYRRTSLAPVGIRTATRPPALVVDDEEEDLPEVVAPEPTEVPPADDAARGDDDGEATQAIPVALYAVEEHAPGADVGEGRDPVDVADDEAGDVAADHAVDHEGKDAADDHEAEDVEAEDVDEDAEARALELGLARSLSLEPSQGHGERREAPE
jgi:hypothetical protein